LLEQETPTTLPSKHTALQHMTWERRPCGDYSSLLSPWQEVFPQGGMSPDRRSPAFPLPTIPVRTFREVDGPQHHPHGTNIPKQQRARLPVSPGKPRPPLCPTFRGRSGYLLPYNGPKLAQARKSAPSRSAVPKAFQALGLKMRSSGTLCMNTGMRSMEARVIRSAPMWP